MDSSRHVPALILLCLAALTTPAALAQDCGPQDPDSDEDGVADACDLCPDDPQYARLELSYRTAFLGGFGAFDQEPTSLSLDASGKIYTTEGNNAARVQVFSGPGQFLYAIEEGGAGEFVYPQAAVGPGGRIFVAERYRYRVQVFNENAGWLFTVGNVGQGVFAQPSGIAVDDDGNFYVTDDYQVKIFDNDGAPLDAFGSEGDEPGQFLGPNGIDVDELGRIYVADSANRRIQVFDARHDFLFEFGGYGEGDGEFRWPRDVTAGGYIFVNDQDNNRIQGFDAQGRFLLTFTNETWPGDGFEKLGGLVLDPVAGQLYVGDTGRVEIFDVTPPDSDADGMPDCADPCPSDPDNDGDGFGMLGQCPPGPPDCDDSDAACTDDCVDNDGDGVMVCHGDCDDADPNCLWDCTDADADGYCVDVDCDDAAAACSTVCIDEDGDSVAVCAGDCDDQAPNCAADCTNADSDEHCVDQDCDDTNPYCSASCVDNDQDGWCIDPTCEGECPLVDCNDNDPVCNEPFACGDYDGDGIATCHDCAPWDPYCFASCENQDGDDFCVETDCDDTNPSCGWFVDSSCDDFDYDGVPWCADCAEGNPNCSTDCTDDDVDGYCITSDCNDDDPTSWEVPPEVRRLSLSHLGGMAGGTVLEWDPVPYPGGEVVYYDVLRSSSAGDFHGSVATCAVTDTLDTDYLDPVNPVEGEILFLLVRAGHGCEGTAGTDSDGNPRDALACD